MRLLFVSNRHTQQRDLVTHPHGRFCHLPIALARMGHEVSVALCSHHALPSERFRREGVDWASEDLRTGGPDRFLGALEAHAKDFRPDWVIGCSDAWYGPLAQRIAKRRGTRLAVDAHDNFEAYEPWNLALHWRWRSSIGAADVVTAAGPQLATRLDGHRGSRSPTQIVPMAADPIFVPHDGFASRNALGLPNNVPLIGYFAPRASASGTHVLLKAFRLVRAKRPDARLVLLGNPPPEAIAEPDVLFLGDLPDAQLPIALSALDVSCVITANTAFGRYSYPAKLCEAMACEIPVVATGTAPVRWMLHDDERRIAPVGDARAIADRLLCDLRGQRVQYRDLPTWEESARSMQAALAS